MKTTQIESSLLAEKILEADIKLEGLRQEVGKIGQPAGHELRRNIEMLRIKENALKRNFEESQRRGEPDSIRIEKIEALLQHIENEESSISHEVNFLHQSAPSSVTLAVEAGSQLVDLYRRGMKHLIGDRHLLGESVFVNHSHANLAEQHGMSESGKEKS